MSSFSLAALLCSRLCHDLVSPVGALSNGIEILADEQDEAMREQVIALIEQSARQTAGRLQFFRLAFGAGGGFGSRIEVDQGKKALLALTEGSKVVLDWQVEPDSLARDGLKLMLNLALIAFEGLVRGGRLGIVLQDRSGQTHLSVTSEGERFILADPVRLALGRALSEEDAEPRTAPALLAGLVAERLGTRINVEPGSGNGARFHAEWAAT